MSLRRNVVRVVLGGLVVLAALFVGVTVGGPIVSGAILLTRPAHGTARPIPEDYQPLHKGHIDVATGLYVREDEDFLLRATPSFVLRRTYRTRDSRSRAFGIGGSHTGEWFLIGDGKTFQWAELILEDGGRIRFDRVSPGTSLFTARYEHWGTPTEFYGAQLAWGGTDWIVRERDGTVLRFRACGPHGDPCGITSRREPDGQTITFVRDAAGTLTRVQAGSQSIAFEYDASGRIVRARDDAQRAVTYTYDAHGRLRRAVASDGATRSYDYDDRDRLTRIEEPGRLVENRYDDADMCVWQRASFPANPAAGILAEEYTFEFSYVMENGRVRQTDTRESGAPSHRRVFTAHGYMESETYDFDTGHPRTITYQRDPETGLVSGLTLKCGGTGRWHTSRMLPATPASEDLVRAQLLATECNTADQNSTR